MVVTQATDKQVAERNTRKTIRLSPILSAIHCRHHLKAIVGIVLTKEQIQQPQLPHNIYQKDDFDQDVQGSDIVTKVLSTTYTEAMGKQPTRCPALLCRLLGYTQITMCLFGQEGEQFVLGIWVTGLLEFFSGFNDVIHVYTCPVIHGSPYNNREVKQQGLNLENADIDHVQYIY